MGVDIEEFAFQLVKLVITEEIWDLLFRFFGVCNSLHSCQKQKKSLSSLQSSR